MKGFIHLPLHDKLLLGYLIIAALCVLVIIAFDLIVRHTFSLDTFPIVTGVSVGGLTYHAYVLKKRGSK